MGSCGSVRLVWSPCCSVGLVWSPCGSVGLAWSLCASAEHAWGPCGSVELVWGPCYLERALVSGHLLVHLFCVAKRFQLQLPRTVDSKALICSPTFAFCPQWVLRTLAALCLTHPALICLQQSFPVLKRQAAYENPCPVLRTITAWSSPKSSSPARSVISALWKQSLGENQSCWQSLYPAAYRLREAGLCLGHTLESTIQSRPDTSQAPEYRGDKCPLCFSEPFCLLPHSSSGGGDAASFCQSQGGCYPLQIGTLQWLLAPEGAGRSITMLFLLRHLSHYGPLQPVVGL